MNVLATCLQKLIEHIILQNLKSVNGVMRPLRATTSRDHQTGSRHWGRYLMCSLTRSVEPFACLWDLHYSCRNKTFGVVTFVVPAQSNAATTNCSSPQQVNDEIERDFITSSMSASATEATNDPFEYKNVRWLRWVWRPHSS